MQLLPRTFATVFLVLLGICATARATEGVQGRVHGVVADESGGVLPGVTVVATSADGRVLATAVTDAVGRYVFEAVPAVPVSLTFQLEGFSAAVVELAVKPDVDAPVATQRLMLAARSETVVVRGKAFVDALPLQPPPPPRPSPPPVVAPVPDHDRDSICGPAKSGATAESFGTIRSRRSAAANNALYAKGDELFIDGGTANGLEVGRNVVARRTFRVSGDPGGATGEHTAGLLQIVAAGERESVAVVIYACDELMRGDRLAAFKPEPRRTPEPAGMPAYDNAARIVLVDVGQLIGAPRRLMVIDRGSDNGVRVGERLTLFRRPRLGADTPSVVGDAVVVAVRIDSATIRVERATDIISLGDWAAPQRYPSATTTSRR
jgi:hypothetical protein